MKLRTTRLFTLLLTLGACALHSNKMGEGVDRAGSSDSSGGGGADLPVSSPASGGSSQQPAPGTGTLTAADWDDNLNFALYGNYATQTQKNLGALPALQPTQVPRHARSNPVNVDMAFVLDTTGSMGDEMAYLEAEVGSIVSRVKASHPNLSVRLGLVLYRDSPQDEYVTRSFDFTDSVATFEANLRAQSAAGGGDYPEAMEKGLAVARQLTWRGGDTVQVLFHIADAPPHPEAYATLMQEAQQAAQQNIVLFPISASGVDDALEYLMRAMAQMSGGRYVFLTNDSGVGNDHQTPTVPCYQVQKLNTLVARLVLNEVDGTSHVPDPNDIVRTVGTVSGRTCALDGNQTAALY